MKKPADMGRVSEMLYGDAEDVKSKVSNPPNRNNFDHDQLERRILGNILCFPETRESLIKQLDESDFPNYGPIFDSFQFYFENTGKIDEEKVQDDLARNGHSGLVDLIPELTFDVSDNPFEDIKQLKKLTDDSWFKPVNPFKEPVKPLEFIIEGVTAKGMITLLGGTAGSGKSILVQYLLQLRDNQPLINVERGKGIFLTGLDSSETEIRRRAKSIGQGEGLFTVAVPDEIVPFITNEIFFQELQKKLIEVDADTVVFDTVADYHEGNLYDASEVNLTMSAFRRLAGATGCAVILITHTRKSADSKRDYSINDIADSRIFATKSDFVFGLKSEYQDDETNLIELRCLKSRSPKPKAPVRAKIEYNEAKGRVSVIPSDRLFQAEESELDERQRIENRRKEAKRLKDEGKSLREIGETLDVSYETIRKDLEHNE